MSFSSLDHRTISCQAAFSTWFPGDRNFYTCTIYRSDLSDENLFFETFHELEEKCDDDIQALAIADSKLPKIPENLPFSFKFLSILCVKQSNLITITKSDLEKFENLTELWLPNNNLKELHEDLFENNRRIERISFSCNKLEVIGEKILEPLKNLKMANFRRNLVIDAIYEEGEGERGLERLKKAIKIKRGRKLRFDRTKSSQEANLEQKTSEISSTLSQSLAKVSESLRGNLESLSLEDKENSDQKVSESFNRNSPKVSENLDRNLPQSSGRIIEENIHAQSTLRNTESSRNFLSSGQTFMKNLRARIQIHPTFHDDPNPQEIFDDSQVNLDESSAIQSVELSQSFLEIPPNLPQLSIQDSSTQTSPSTFINDLNRFLYDENFKDFAIKVPVRTFQVHKFVMAARSPTLNKMLRENPNLKGVEIPDTNDKIVEIVLDFIYDDQMPTFIKIDETLMVFDLAMKLDIEKVSKAAEDEIMRKLSKENSIKVLEMANKHENHRIKAAAFEFVKEIFPEKKFKEKILSDKREMTKMLEGLKMWQKSLHEATSRFSKMSFFESDN